MRILSFYIGLATTFVLLLTLRLSKIFHCGDILRACVFTFQLPFGYRSLASFHFELCNENCTEQKSKQKMSTKWRKLRILEPIVFRKRTSIIFRRAKILNFSRRIVDLRTRQIEVYEFLSKAVFQFAIYTT